MPDREKVVNDLQDAVNDDWLWRHADYYALTMERAIALLKEQKNPDEEQDSTGNNGPLRRITTEDVVAGLIKLANGGILADEWRNVIMDAITLIWMGR